MIDELDDKPMCDEVAKGIKQLSFGKAPVSYGIPTEIYNCGGAHMVSRLTEQLSVF